MKTRNLPDNPNDPQYTLHHLRWGQLWTYHAESGVWVRWEES